MKDAPEKSEKSPDAALRRRRTTGIILLVIGGVALLSRAYGWGISGS